MKAINGSRIQFVDTSEEFEKLCSHLNSVSWVGLDTEFVRTNTFYGRLGLLQISDSNKCYLIDPKKISCWKCFVGLLKNTSNSVVMHSSSEDLNILKTTINEIPENLFDSQLAAAFLGIGFSLSYQSLVGSILNVEIEKNETRSDWLKRPLSKSQLQYAANDVCYLLPLKNLLKEKLSEVNRLQWFQEECLSMLSAASEFDNPSGWEKNYSSIKNAWKLEKSNLEHLQKLCYWREVKARELNKPKSWIAKDGDLYKLSVSATDVKSLTIRGLASVEFDERGLIVDHGEELLAVLRESDSSLCPVEDEILNRPLSSAGRKTLKTAQKIVGNTAERLSIAPELLGRKRSMQKLIRDFETFGELRWSGELSGWRREILESEISTIF
ncbi:MAG: hypothetical protein P8N40_01895 [Gammaproteobacteria bacterium]|nr:hypothetical protein [Gammaproteobacteria bacterium]